jgi:hypothetical protein
MLQNPLCGFNRIATHLATKKVCAPGEVVVMSILDKKAGALFKFTVQKL